VAATADRVLPVMEEHRSSSHIWHVRGEAQRQIRGAGITTNRLDQLVNLLGPEVLGSGLIASRRSLRVFPPSASNMPCRSDSRFTLEALAMKGYRDIPSGPRPPGPLLSVMAAPRQT
jgi:hypothetical protein